MSEHQLPFHIQEEILKRLPVKSLIQFRSVSKAWKSLIDSSDFIAAHSISRHTQPQHLLVSYGIWDLKEEVKYVSFVDDDTFPQQKYVLTVPSSAKELYLPAVIGSSHGLVCIYGSDFISNAKLAVIWNPFITKSIVVDVPDETFVGFGVCPVTCDPKIVAITQSQDLNHCEVMVYSLSSGKWNPSSNLPTIRLRDAWSPIVTDRFMYWIAGRASYMIMSFDVTNHNFKAIALPESVATNLFTRLSMTKIREPLAMFEDMGNDCTTVWMMDDNVQGSFTRLFTIQALAIVGFRKSGIPVTVVRDGDGDGDDDDDKVYKVVVYEPHSEHDNALEIPGPSRWFGMSSYVETLLLLGRSDCNID